jgi:hypothetical protein
MNPNNYFVINEIHLLLYDKNNIMKNFIKIVALLCLFAVNVNAQITFPSIKPYNTSTEQYSQMWNTSNVYRNTPTYANLGSQLDTTSGTTASYVYTAQLYTNYAKSVSNTDTFLPSPLLGKGNINLTASVLKCTGTDTITLTPVCSLDGIHWKTISGLTAATLYPTSLTVPVVTEWNLPMSQAQGGKSSRYYGLKAVGNSGTTISLQGWYYYQPY